MAGAIRNTSARRATSTCASASSVSNMSTIASCPVSDWKVSGAMKRVAASVINTSTLAPAWRSLLARSAAL